MKKLSFLLVTALILVTFFVSCDKDDAKSDDVPSGFLASHVGNWKTTFTEQNVDEILNVSSSKVLVYAKSTAASCYNLIQSPGGGNAQVLEDTTQKLSIYTTSIPASSIFSGDDLNLLISNGYTTVTSSEVFLHTSSTVISYESIVYAGNTTIELLAISADWTKINSFVNCAGAKMINLESGTKYKLSKSAIMLLKQK
jgi:hypothetical protein